MNRSRILLSLILAGSVVLALTIHAPGQDLRDPMRPPQQLNRAQPTEEVVQAPLPDLRLHSTIISGDQRSAVINGIPLGLGDSIAGARVMRINLGNVQLMTDNNNWITLGFTPTDMLQPTDFKP